MEGGRIQGEISLLLSVSCASGEQLRSEQWFCTAWAVEKQSRFDELCAGRRCREASSRGTLKGTKECDRKTPCAQNLHGKAGELTKTVFKQRSRLGRLALPKTRDSQRRTDTGTRGSTESPGQEWQVSQQSLTSARGKQTPSEPPQKGASSHPPSSGEAHAGGS